jgi:ATP-dependent DNA helicase RecG
LLLKNKELSIEKLAESVGITARSIERNISILKDKGLLERVGSDRTGYWNVTAGIKKETCLNGKRGRT